VQSRRAAPRQGAALRPLRIYAPPRGTPQRGAAAGLGVGDPLLLGAVLALALLGVAMVFSAGVLELPSSVVTGLWRTQLIWLVASILVAAAAMRVPVIWVEWAAQPIYGAAVLLLVVALFAGTGAGTAASVSGWLSIGPIRIQPAELAKLAVILMLARQLGGQREAPATLWGLWKPVAIAGIPMALVMGQPDLGTALVFVAILFAALFWAGTPFPLLLFLASPAIGLLLAVHTWVWGLWIVLLFLLVLRFRPFVSEAVAVLLLNVAAGTLALPLWNRLELYQQNRLLVFLDPSIDPRGAGYNLIQSRVAIGSGGWFGKGFTEGTQKRLAFLPEQHTDFIFSVVGEELGFVGVALVLLLFGAVFWRLVRVAERAPDPFGSLVPFALLGSWFAHVVVNTGMTIGVMPITGIPLPFISYGGSFLMVNMLALGLVQRIAAESGGRSSGRR
jgi:rod shape determining protein RodA